MVRTKGTLSSSFGAWLFLFMGVALFLLPTTLSAVPGPSTPDPGVVVEPPRHCYGFHYEGFRPECFSPEDVCVKRWRLDESPEKPGTAIGCSSKKEFSEDHGFEASDGACMESETKKKEFICACTHSKLPFCNDDKFGEGEAKKWREGETNPKTKGGSSGLRPCVTFFAALLSLTVAILF